MNDFQIAPKFRFIHWIREAFFLLVDRPFFWFGYTSFFSILFALYSNVVYLHFVSILFVLSTVNVARYFYSKEEMSETWLILKKHILYIFLLLFASILVRYIFWLSSNSLLLDVTIFQDYLNPLDMMRLGLWQSQFDLFLFNLVVMPFHYVQIISLTLFFTASIFFYPLFMWSSNSAIFAYKLNLRVTMANLGNVGFVLLFIVLVSLAVFLYALIAFPYLYLWASLVLYCMWADIFYEKKDTAKNYKNALVVAQVVKN